MSGSQLSSVACGLNVQAVMCESMISFLWARKAHQFTAGLVTFPSVFDNPLDRCAFVQFEPQFSKDFEIGLLQLVDAKLLFWRQGCR